ncbi:DUF6957 family protein [Stutzerimonas stutzeri]|uniref:DUF6957 family protein n=1 Tax=Stutzerimonas stutzeri TaxID=316 RepID=UPI000F7A6625|nr:hypothetical protein [Stutzerimonas stutzeri]MCP3430658.1 hypothetical protein [Stutzerimonas stutzeri]RTM17050.1 hypothetical protein EKN22_17635 [Stutzerimonas stutzeri]
MDEQTARRALLDAPGTVMLGHTMAGETILALRDEHFPGRQFCLIRNWIWIDLDLPDAARDGMSSMQLQPVMLYGDVLIDSVGRFDEGDWLRSTPLVSFSQGCLFETRDTVYVLLGHGLRKRAELSVMVKIFRVEGD